jgi:hypothetical protein
MTLCAVCFACLSGCTGEQTASMSTSDAKKQAGAIESRTVRDVPDAEELARSYDNLTLITKEPVLVDPQLASLCVGISQQAVDDARKRYGPHAHTSVKIFMNEIAAEAFRDGATAYPVGSVIVKEKLGLEYDLVDAGGERERNAAKTASGVGGMIKRAAGYDPEHGDWEYFYFEDPTKVEHGKIASCVECHRGAAATDYVFGGWAANQ